MACCGNIDVVVVRVGVHLGSHGFLSIALANDAEKKKVAGKALGALAGDEKPHDTQGTGELARLRSVGLGREGSTIGDEQLDAGEAERVSAGEKARAAGRDERAEAHWTLHL